MNMPKIPAEEYAQRRARAAQIAAQRGIDVLLFSSTESDFADVRYFTGYYTFFERASVAIAANGECALIVGPEGPATARATSQLQNIFSLHSHRESSGTDYPELDVNSLKTVFTSLGIRGEKIRIGIGNYLYTSVEIYLDLLKEYPNAEIIPAADIVINLRKKKSPNEISCLKAAYSIAEKAVGKVLEEIRPGMSECNVAGIALRYIYEFGAEEEGMPQMVLSDDATKLPCARPKTHRIIQRDSFLTLGIAARVDGYSASIGIPVSMGKFTPEQLRHVEFGRDLHEYVKTQLCAGKRADEVAKRAIEYYEKYGFSNTYLYGPLHGVGLIEAEPPAVESNSDYILEENLCYQVDNFVFTKDFGLRWEEGICITKDGYEPLNTTPICHKLYELGF